VDAGLLNLAYIIAATSVCELRLRFEHTGTENEGVGEVMRVISTNNSVRMLSLSNIQEKCLTDK
jgi:hypothetical protein